MVGQCKQGFNLVVGIAFVGLLTYLAASQSQDRLYKDKNVSHEVVPQSVLHPLAYSEEAVFYLTQALYFEDALGSVECQLMIAHVVQNRMLDHRFPNTIKEVVWENRQFSFTQDGKHERMLIESTRARLEQLARLVLGGYSLDTTGGANWYYNPAIADPVWKDDYQVFTKCGKHVFLIEKQRAGWE